MWSPFKDCFLNDFCRQSYWFSDCFLNPDQVHILLKESYEIEAKDELRPAAIGKGLIKQRNTDIRTDKVHWLETFETKPQRLVYDIFEGLRQLARTELYLPLKRFECHFSKYEAGGFYKRHSDRHANLPSRVLSCV